MIWITCNKVFCDSLTESFDISLNPTQTNYTFNNKSRAIRSGWLCRRYEYKLRMIVHLLHISRNLNTLLIRRRCPTSTRVITACLVIAWVWVKAHACGMWLNAGRCGETRSLCTPLLDSASDMVIFAYILYCLIEYRYECKYTLDTWKKSISDMILMYISRIQNIMNIIQWLHEWSGVNVVSAHNCSIYTYSGDSREPH